MVEMYQEEICLSGSGDNCFDQEIFVKGNLVNSSSDLYLDSGIITGNLENKGVGDVYAKGTVIIGGDLILEGGDLDGNFVILGKLINNGCGDITGNISASGYKLCGQGDFYAKKAPLTAEAMEKIRNCLGKLSDLKPGEPENASVLIELNLKQSFDQLAKSGININFSGNCNESNSSKTGNIQREHVDTVSSTESMNKGQHLNTDVLINSSKQIGELIALDIVKTLNKLREQCEKNEEIFSITLTLDVLSKKIIDENAVKNITALSKMLRSNYDDFAKPNDLDKKRIIGVCKYIEEIYSCVLIHGNLEKNE